MIEGTARIEPTLLEAPTGPIADAISELSAAAATLGKLLHPRTASDLADHVRIMNAYYSNLIEGHDTLPRDIERALAGDLDSEERRRDLQIEAAAHVRVQRKIDALAASGALPPAASRGFIRELHRLFYESAPESALTVRSGGRALTMIPGEWRQAGQDVSVGRHVPPSGAQVDAFMAVFEQRFRLDPLGRAGRLMALASAHHRLNYIHPFLDGNGRVSRLMTHAMAVEAGVGANGLWSISRGLARGLESRTDYKRMMDHADMPRQGDRDGRGDLSERALQDFVLWFLKVCLDQIAFMSGLFDLDGLSRRLARLADRHPGLKPEAGRLLQAALMRGELARGDAAVALGLPERTARREVAALLDLGLLGSDTPKGPLSLRFPASALDDLFPKLYPAS